MKENESHRSLTSTAHVALSGAVFALALTAFGTVVYGVRTASSSADVAAGSLTSKLASQQLFVKAARIADITKEERAELLTHIIAAGEGAEFISQVESLGEKAGTPITIASLDTTSGTADDPGMITLSLRFKGTYSACMRLVHLIETLPYSLSAPSLELNYDDTALVWNGTLNFSVLSFDTP